MDTLLTALDYGRYGPYIWGAYGATLVILAGLWIASNRASLKVTRELDALRPKRPAPTDTTPEETSA